MTPINSLYKNEKSYDGKAQMRITSETSSTYLRCNPNKILHCSILHSFIMPFLTLKHTWCFKIAVEAEPFVFQFTLEYFS